MASESGSSTDSHAETPENKDGESLVSILILTQCGVDMSPLFTAFLSSTVKKKSSAGLKFSNLMNIGKKKPSSLENPGKCVDTSGKHTSLCQAKL